MNESTLSVQNISKVYRKRKVVNDVSFHVNQGEIVGLLGPNGAGKTTSFYIAVGLVKPSDGAVWVDGEDVTEMPMYMRARKGVGYMPQEDSIFRRLTVEENIKAILETMSLEKEEIDSRCISLLEQFKVDHVRTQLGYTLSGGERRRVEICRALASRPKILLLDEPFAGVDPLAVKDIQNVVLQVRELGVGVLITDHNVRETLKIVSRAYIMSEGRILIKGSANDLIENEEAKRVYLGEDFTL